MPMTNRKPFLLKMGRRIQELRKRQGLNAAAVAERADVEASFLSKLENGLVWVGPESLSRIARALGVGVSEIFDEGSNVEPALIGTRRIPVLDHVQAGAWTGVNSAISESDIREFVLTSLDTSPDAFAMFVRGDSMTPEFHEGDMIIVDPAVQPKPGSYVVAVNGSGEATFKRYRERGLNEKGQNVFELVPLNRDYPTMRSDVVNIRIIGAVVELRKFMRK